MFGLGGPTFGGGAGLVPGFGGGGATGAGLNPGSIGGSISGSHTSTGVEAAFTYVTYTFPRPATPQYIVITTSAGSGLVQIVLDNQRNLNIPFALNTVVQYPIVGVLSAMVNALSVGFEALSGVMTVTATVHYL